MRRRNCRQILPLGRSDPAAEMGGGVEEVIEMNKEEVCREFLLEDGDKDDNDDDMNEMRDGMLTFYG